MRGISDPYAHAICIGDAADVEMPQLNQVAHPRPLETAEDRASRALMIDENKLRRLKSGHEDVVRSQVAVNISRAVQPRDLRTERAQYHTPCRELRALQM